MQSPARQAEAISLGVQIFVVLYLLYLSVLVETRIEYKSRGCMIEPDIQHIIDQTDLGGRLRI